MKRITLVLSVLSVIAISVFLSCQRSISDFGPAPEIDKPETLVTATVQGRVIDQDGIPVEAAVVKIGAATTVTDINGTFLLEDASLSNQFGYITVEKPGFFMGSRSIITEDGALNYIQVELLPKIEKGSFEATVGGTIPVDGSTDVTFMPGSIIKAADSSVYTGDVKVYAAYLDPTVDGLENRMPGDLRGVQEDGSVVGLETYGMMVVELETATGEKLAIAKGMGAILSMDIPAALQATAPAEIPLWYFNEENGKWIEEGKAIKQGNAYVGSVKHFSFWNCDAPFPVVNIEAQLVNEDGDPLPYVTAFIKVQETNSTARNTGLIGYGKTDDNGFLRGAVPKDKKLTLEVYNSCSEIIYSEQYGPLNAASDLGKIVINSFFPELQITASVINCNGDPVTNGVATVSLDGLYYRNFIHDGTMSFLINRCSRRESDLVITVADNETLESGGANIIPVTEGQMDIGVLEACGSPFRKLVKCAFNGLDYTLTNMTDSINFTKNNNGNDRVFSRDLVNSSEIFDMEYTTSGGVNGDYAVASLILMKDGLRYIKDGDMSCTIIEEDADQKIVRGTFSGSIVRDTNVVTPSYPFTGSFRINY